MNHFKFGGERGEVIGSYQRLLEVIGGGAILLLSNGEIIYPSFEMVELSVVPNICCISRFYNGCLVQRIAQMTD